MGYRDQNGIVGQYRGENVFVVGYKDLKQPAPNDHTIYAVRCNNNDKLELVQGGKFIGTMTDSGHVEIYDASRRRPYKFYTKEKQQPSKPVPEYEIKKVADPEPIKDVSTLVLNTEYGYGVYSKIVDDFFHGLDKLWDELEV